MNRNFYPIGLSAVLDSLLRFGDRIHDCLCPHLHALHSDSGSLSISSFLLCCVCVPFIVQYVSLRLLYICFYFICFSIISSFLYALFLEYGFSNFYLFIIRLFLHPYVVCLFFLISFPPEFVLAYCCDFSAFVILHFHYTFYITSKYYVFRASQVLFGDLDTIDENESALLHEVMRYTRSPTIVKSVFDDWRRNALYAPLFEYLYTTGIECDSALDVISMAVRLNLREDPDERIGYLFRRFADAAITLPLAVSCNPQVALYETSKTYKKGDGSKLKTVIDDYKHLVDKANSSNPHDVRCKKRVIKQIRASTSAKSRTLDIAARRREKYATECSKTTDVLDGVLELSVLALTMKALYESTPSNRPVLFFNYFRSMFPIDLSLSTTSCDSFVQILRDAPDFFKSLFTSFQIGMKEEFDVDISLSETSFVSYDTFKASPLYKQGAIVASKLVGLVLNDYYKLNFPDLYKHISLMLKVQESGDLILDVLSILGTVVTNVALFATTGKVEDLIMGDPCTRVFYRAFELETLLTVSNTVEELNECIIRSADIEKELSLQMAMCGPTNPKFRTLSDTLIRLRKVKHTAHKNMNGVTPMCPPFVMQITGPSSVGKSKLMLSSVIVCQAVDGLKPSQAYIHEKNMDEKKFDSTYETHKKYTTLDDAGNSDTGRGTEGHSIGAVFRMIGMFSQSVSRSESSEKGDYTYSQRMIALTSNSEWMNTDKYFTTPHAVMRRLRHFVLVSVKPEFSVSGVHSDSSALDESKLAGHDISDATHMRVYIRHVDERAIGGIRKEPVVDHRFKPHKIVGCDDWFYDYRNFLALVEELYINHKANGESIVQDMKGLFSSFDKCSLCGRHACLCCDKRNDPVSVTEEGVAKAREATTLNPVVAQVIADHRCNLCGKPDGQCHCCVILNDFDTITEEGTDLILSTRTTRRTPLMNTLFSQIMEGVTSDEESSDDGAGTMSLSETSRSDTVPTIMFWLRHHLALLWVMIIGFFGVQRSNTETALDTIKFMTWTPKDALDAAQLYVKYRLSLQGREAYDRYVALLGVVTGGVALYSAYKFFFFKHPEGTSFDVKFGNRVKTIPMDATGYIDPEAGKYIPSVPVGWTRKLAPFRVLPLPERLTTTEKLHSVVKNNLVRVVVKHEDSEKSSTGFFVRNRTIATVSHGFPKGFAGSDMIVAVTLHHSTGCTNTFMLAGGQCKGYADYDLVYFAFLPTNDRPDISEYLVHGFNTPVSIEGCTLYAVRDGHEIVASEHDLKLEKADWNTSVGKFSGLVFSSKVNCIVGDSGGPVLSSKGVVGMLVASNRAEWSEAARSSVAPYSVFTTLPPLSDEDEGLMYGANLRMPFRPLQGVSLMECSSPYSVANSMPPGSAFSIVGVAKSKKRANPKSQFVLSRLGEAIAKRDGNSYWLEDGDVVSKCFSIPDLQGRTVRYTNEDGVECDAWVDPLTVGFGSLVAANIEPPDFLATMCVMDQVEMFKDQKFEFSGRANINQVLNGAEGMVSINKKSSAGLRLGGKNIDHLVLNNGKYKLRDPAAYKHYCQEMYSGISPRLISNAAVKDEIISAEKNAIGKVRLFQVGDLHFLLFCKQYIGPLMDVVRLHPEFFEIAIGINCMGVEWSVLHRFIATYEDIIALDFVGFDANEKRIFLLKLHYWFQTLMECCRCTPDYMRCVHMALDEAIHVILCVDGFIFELERCLGSGNPITTMINCIIAGMYMRAAWYISRHTGFYHLMNKGRHYGDDTVVSTGAKTFTQIVIHDALLTIGVGVTSAEKGKELAPFVPIEEVTFLKRRFLPYVIHGKEYVLCPLEEDSIYRMLMFTSAEDEVRKAVEVGNVIDAQKQWFFHGRDVFDKRMVWLGDACAKAHVDITILSDGKWYTWDELADDYVKGVLVTNFT